MKRQKKVVNLADRKEVMELMKQLYGKNGVKDDQTLTDNNREPRTTRTGKVDELSPNN